MNDTLVRIERVGQDYVQVFDSWWDYVDFCEHHATDSPTQTSRDSWGDMEWYGGVSFDQAVTLARTGWDKPLLDVETFAAHVERNIDTEVFQTSFRAVWDVTGSEVDVPRFLAGLPENMIESEPIRISSHGRAVRLVIGGSASSGVDPEQIRQRGAAVVALADILARAQHPLEVWVSYDIGVYGGTGKKGEAKTVRTIVKVQAANDALDIPRLLFALAHPASLRRLTFSAWENIEDKPLRNRVVNGSYGHPVEPVAERAPECPENTILLGNVDWGAKWDEKSATAWVVEQVESVFN